ncbi:MAG: hypothetical protein Q8880_03730 [Bacteroidota bacterium]|nr:hypothetical protein [Bacteroidota bacterium]
MKKLSILCLCLVVFSALCILSSCRVHQTCPAYGHGSINIQKTLSTKTV